MNKEDFFISCFGSDKIGDDGAIVEKWIISKDAFFENVHFKREWFSLDEIAYKAMLVNISDAVAMNAEPKYALLAVALPSSMSKAEIKLLYSGFNKAAKEFDVEIIGGDTISNVKIDITITILAKSKKVLKRSTLKRGDLLAYTGSLGGSQKVLKSLLNRGMQRRKSRFFAPVLRKKFISKAVSSLSCGMDISDGLFSDLKKLSVANRLGFSFYKAVPKQVACSAEEYEMLVSFSPRERKKIVRLAKATRTKLTIFAKAVRKSYKSKCKAHHF